MRIISWNVNGLHATLGNGSFGPVLARRPDVLCVQETRCQDEPEVLPGALHLYNRPARKGYAGTLAAFAREPRDADFGVSGVEDDGGRVITSDLGAFTLVSLYVPHTGDRLSRELYREEWADAVEDHVETLAEAGEVVVCGDMNATLSAEDIYERSGWREREDEGFASEARSMLYAFEDMGLVDAFRALHPGERGAFTWWSNRRNRRAVNHGWRLDYFFVSEGLMGRVESCDILADVPGSDHAPIELVVAC